MSNHLSAIAWFLGAVLAAVVVVGGVRTSSARFSGSTANGSNVWQAAELALDVDVDGDRGDQGSTTALFLDGEGLYPGVVLENCVPVSVTTTLDQVRVRLHGTPTAPVTAVSSNQEGREDLSRFFNVVIELGSAGAGCANFSPDQEVFSGTLGELTSNFRTFETGLPLKLRPSETSYLRFTGSVTDTNDAQGLSAEYTIHMEARP